MVEDSEVFGNATRDEKHRERARLIVRRIKKMPNGGPDVLVFSEAFHKGSYQRLATRLIDSGPYVDQVGPPNRAAVPRNGGVYIVSK